MLDRSFLGNTILDWAIAVGAALLTGVVLIAVRMQGLRWLAVRNSKPYSRSIGWALSAFEGTKPWFLIAVAMFVGLQFVAIPPKGRQVPRACDDHWSNRASPVSDFLHGNGRFGENFPTRLFVAT
jgi:hypothetical protein